MSAEGQANLLGTVQLFHRAIRANDATTAGYWLNRFHDIMDFSEDCGMSVAVNLPQLSNNSYHDGGGATQLRVCRYDWPLSPIAWGATFEEPRRNAVR